jgi:hypothetical protein
MQYKRLMFCRCACLKTHISKLTPTTPLRAQRRRSINLLDDTMRLICPVRCKLLVRADSCCQYDAHSCSGRRLAQIPAWNRSPLLERLESVLINYLPRSARASTRYRRLCTFEPGSPGSNILDASGSRTSGSTSNTNLEPIQLPWPV